jgi:hypothetical protein
VLYKKLVAHGITPTVLLNDYRATMVAKELGIKDSTPIDAIYNIATIADVEDGLIVDSPELSDSLLEQMCNYFKTTVIFSNEQQKYTEKIISQTNEDANSVRMLLIDEHYFEQKPKSSQTALFAGDEDYEKKLLKESNNYLKMDLLLGHYFFLGYENELKDRFEGILEDYDRIGEYENVVTKSLQTLFEAAASGAKVCYVGEELLSLVTLKEEFDITVKNPLSEPISGDSCSVLDIQKIKNISEKLNYNIIFEKLDLSQFKFK